EGGSRNRTRLLFASCRDKETQRQLAAALPAFHDKVALIQFGSWDPMKQQGWHERWAKEIPDSETHIIPHVAHFTFEGGPEESVENFRKWWSAVEHKEGLAPRADPPRKLGPSANDSIEIREEYRKSGIYFRDRLGFRRKMTTKATKTAAAAVAVTALAVMLAYSAMVLPASAQTPAPQASASNTNTSFSNSALPGRIAGYG